MAATTSRQNAKSSSTRTAEKAETPAEITNDIVEYLTEYARNKPGYAALWCLGVGFVLGWKLKPW